MQNQSWSTLANLLVQRGRLSFDVAAAIAKVEPSSSLVWMDAFLERNDAGFTASSLAQWMSDTAGLVRLSPREWQTFLNHRPTQSPRLPHAPQGLVWLGGSPACLGIVDASDSAVLQRLRFLLQQVSILAPLPHIISILPSPACSIRVSPGRHFLCHRRWPCSLPCSPPSGRLSMLSEKNRRRY